MTPWFVFVMIIGTLFSVSAEDGWSIDQSKTLLTISGQITCSDGSNIMIEPDSRVILQLQGLSLNYDRPMTIAQQMWHVSRFPIDFNIDYRSCDVRVDYAYELNARIVNKDNVITFSNNERITVKLSNSGRVMFIKIPLVSFEPFDHVRIYDALQWPELVGLPGITALQIIKKETGLKKIFIVTENSKLPKDIRYDRVYIYVDEKTGLVIHMPSVG